MANHERTLKRFLGRVSICALVTALVVSPSAQANAELIAADTANAMPGWYGTEVVQFEESSGKFVDGSIDYVVYAPRQFNSSFPGQDPSNGDQYVYRYQIHNNADSSTDFIKKLTVGLVAGTNAANCTFIDPGPLYDPDNPSGGKWPDFVVQLAGTPPTSANWFYTNTGAVQPGEDSKMLIFTSPYGPTLRFATVHASSRSTYYVDFLGMQWNRWEGQLPSPVPEPASLFSLLALGAFFGIYRVLRHKWGSFRFFSALS